MSYGIWNRLQYVLSPQFDIYEQVSKIVNGRVLDVGSGTGFGTHLFTRNAKLVFGIDVDDLAVKFANRTFSNGNIHFIVDNINSDELPIRSAASYFGIRKFDFITMIDVIEHIREDKLAIQNVRRLLKEDGTFICSTPNKLSRYRKSEYHVREYTPPGLKALMESVFETVDIVDFQLQPAESEFENPIIALCV